MQTPDTPNLLPHRSGLYSYEKNGTTYYAWYSSVNKMCGVGWSLVAAHLETTHLLHKHHTLPDNAKSASPKVSNFPDYQRYQNKVHEMDQLERKRLSYKD